MTRYIQHHTINTGRSMPIRREQIADQALGHCKGLIATVTDGGRATLPVPGGYYLTGVKVGGILLVTVMGGEDSLATIAVVRRERSAHRFWADLMARATAVDPSIDTAMPRAPFIATMLWPAINLEADAALWIADLGNCLGWAWMDYHSDGTDQKERT